MKVAAKLSKSARNMLARLIADECGVEPLEWAMLLGLLVIGAMVGAKAVGINLAGRWNDILNSI